jgi:hypothetical protein
MHDLRRDRRGSEITFKPAWQRLAVIDTPFQR